MSRRPEAARRCGVRVRLARGAMRSMWPSNGCGPGGEIELSAQEQALSSLDFIVRAAFLRKGRLGIPFGAERLALVPFRAPSATVFIALALAVLAVLGIQIQRIRIDDSLSQLFQEVPACKWSFSTW